MRQSHNDFSAIALRIASPEVVRAWSHGEVTKPETINYRTQRPELDGLFCERIFGPSKNYECYCGKYKRIRYKGIVCEKCGVEVTKSLVRRERMGHVDLCVPVAHTWFVRSTPSRIGLALDMPIKTLEQVLYFAAYVVVSVDEEEKKMAQNDLKEQSKALKKQLQEEHREQEVSLKAQMRDGNASEEVIAELEARSAERMEELREALKSAEEELARLETGTVISELEYRNLSMKFGHVFRAATGAEAIRTLLERINIPEELERLKIEKESSSGQRQIKAIKTIQFYESLLRSDIRPEWMMVTALPIIPPDLRPMVQLDGGRFAASDLNDLYRRIINRNNRLKRLIAIGAPEVICRNEKRMLQEAVDTLFNNSPRAGRMAFSTDKRKLKSLSDMLKGKQGRFRQNLLGKRVDYSGRSVIVVGPQLKLHQCGLPKEMALKLFKPFVIGKLIQGEYTHNVKGAERIINAGDRVVWDLLEEVIKDKCVLLNRAPTLHRLGIQAFQPVLVEGRAIQIHPLVCSAFNADFDGDQMAVHLPLSEAAQAEAKKFILASRNILKPSSGDPIVTPSQDIILGIYYLTNIHDGMNGEGSVFESLEAALFAHASGVLDLQARVTIRYRDMIITDTSLGRVLFNEIIPAELGFRNQTFKNKTIESLFTEVFETVEEERMVKFADDIKDIGFRYSTISGVSIAASDMLVPSERETILEISSEKVDQVTNFYQSGLITDDERYNHSIRIWGEAKNKVSESMVKGFQKHPKNHIYYMIDSGARGNWGQITQLCGMKGLVANPGGRTIELPIKSNLKQGFSIVEYFIATHGGRKGKSDTALKTAEAGYLTRRLVDSVQDIIVREEDCGNMLPYIVSEENSKALGLSFEKRMYGRYLAAPVANRDGEVIADANTEITREVVRKILDAGITEVSIRSILDCKVEKGVCQKCYGRDLGNNKKVEMGTPIGIIAAQSIGEPGTQLTMRTFHMGGVADAGNDITQGLARVEELFEARSPKTPAVLSDIAGKVRFDQREDILIIHVEAQEEGVDSYTITPGFSILVKEGDEVKAGKVLAKGTQIIRATYAGVVEKIAEAHIIIRHKEKVSTSYTFRGNENFLVQDGSLVKAGDPLTSGHFNLKELLKRTDFATVQRYITREVQGIYASQGQTIHDKHMEVIVREMFSRVRILDKGGFEELVNGEITDFYKVLRLIRNHPEKKTPLFERQLMGLTRSSLTTDSWLSAASFQETIRVLVDAATTGKRDSLDGLKENVIIGKLIPAGEIYRARLAKDNAETVEA